MANYKMKYISGDGTEYDGGIWDIKQTPKTTIFKLIKEPFFDLCCPAKMVISSEKEKNHCLRDWQDGTFTVYPFQSGTPHIFEPIGVLAL